jgi:hypothetical protein
MLSIKKAISIVIVCISAFGAVAQDDDYKKYLDDGKVSTPSNAFKFNISGLTSGDLGLNYERKITRALSIEIGASLPYNVYKEDIFYRKNIFFIHYLHEIMRHNRNLYGFSIQPRFYFFKGAINFRSYVSYMYRRKYHEFRNEILAFGENIVSIIPITEQAIHLGYQLQKGKRFLWDISIGGSKFSFTPKKTGISSYYDNTKHLSTESHVIFTSTIKFGILF